MYHDVRLFPKAIAMYEHYLELNPSNVEARVDLGTSYFELSFEDTTKKRECIAAAKDEVERALSYAPNHQLALFNLGIILLHTGDVDKALASFRKCATVDSTSDVGRKALQFVNQHSSMESS
jgi:tetratricopeptide (TPR) repeat protein